jgi:hypothetical protein
MSFMSLGRTLVGHAVATAKTLEPEHVVGVVGRCTLAKIAPRDSP